MKTYTVTRTLPNGTVKTTEAENIRRAGQTVAYCLADNCNVPRKEATRLAMQFEKTGTLESHGYTFRLDIAHA